MTDTDRETLGTVLVHGGFGTKQIWNQVLPLIEGPVIAIDLPGRGVRPVTGREVTYDDCVAAVIEEADRAGFDRFVLVGHSMGGSTVTRTIDQHPDRVLHGVYLAALAMAPGVNVKDHYGFVWPDDIDRTGYRDPLPAENARHMFHGDLSDDEFEQAHAQAVPEPVGLSLDAVRRYNHDVPTTYIAATRDVAVPPEMVTAMLEHLQPDHVMSIEGDHDIMVSHPRECAEALNEVIRGALTPTDPAAETVNGCRGGVGLPVHDPA